MSHQKKVKVLLICDHLGFDGKIMHGVGKLFLQWLPHYTKSKFFVFPCILRKMNNLNRPFEEKGFDIISLGRGKYDPFSLIDILGIIRRERIDLIHAHGFGASTLARIARILLGLPILVHFHDTRSFYPLIQKTADTALARFTDAGIAVSHSVKRFWVENGRLRGMDPRKILVMHNCVDLNEFGVSDSVFIHEQRQRLGIVSQDTKIVGTVTRFFEQKGNVYFLKAAAEILKHFPKTKFVLVGDGPLKGELEHLCKELKISEHVIFCGFRSDVRDLLTTFDVKVFSSWSGDGGSPLPVLEAMAIGKPVVATDMVEILEDGVTGLVVPKKDSEALAKGVMRLLADEALGKRLGRVAREESKKFDVRSYVERLEDIYSSLVSSRNLLFD